MSLDNFRRQQLEGLDTEQKVWRLYIDSGMTTRQVGEALEIAPATVSRALARAEKRALAAMVSTVTAHKVKALERLEHLYRTSMDAYASSCVVARERTRAKRKTGAEGNSEETEIVKETARGNPRYLAEARSAVADIRKLLGLDAPAKVSIVDPDRPFRESNEDDVRRELAAALREAGVDAGALSDTPPAPDETRH
jgi:DNA-binding MarR family transcriptional regulator